MKTRYLKIVGILLLSCLLIFTMVACSNDASSISSSDDDGYNVTIEVRGLSEEESLEVLIESKGDYDNPSSVRDFEWIESNDGGIFKAEVLDLKGEVDFIITKPSYRNFWTNRESVSASSSDNKVTFYADGGSGSSIMKLNIESQALPRTNIGVYKLKITEFFENAVSVGIILDKDEGIIDKARSLSEPIYTVAKEDFEEGLDLALINSQDEIISIGYLDLNDDGEKSVELERLEEPINITLQEQSKTSNISTQSQDYLAKYEINIDEEEESLEVDGKTDSLILGEQAVDLPDEYIAINYIAIEIDNLFIRDSDKFWNIFNDQYQESGSLDDLDLYVKTWGNLYDWSGKTGEELDISENEIAFEITQVYGDDFEARASLLISYQYNIFLEGRPESGYEYEISVQTVRGLGGRANSFMGPDGGRVAFGGEISGFTKDQSITIYIFGDEPDEDPPGDGESPETAYEISTAGQLNDFVRRKGVTEERVYFKQIKDIDLSKFDDWRPIGDDENNKFNGYFDGDGHIISGLEINKPNQSYKGLFGFLGRRSVIDRVNLEEVNIIGNRNVGAIAGQSEGYIRESNVEGEILGTYDYIGGLVGENLYRGKIELSTFTGNISGETRIGGLVGGNNGGEIQHSNANVDIEGLNMIGGLVGRNRRGGIVAGNSTARGSVTGVGDELDVVDYDIGGLIGLNYRAYVQNSSSIVLVEGQGESTSVGGLVGRNFSGVISNSKAYGDVFGYNSVGGLVGYNRNPSTAALADITFQTINESISALNLDDLNPGEVIRSEAHGDVHGEHQKIGGLIGYTDTNTFIKDSESFGNVSSNKGEIGGLVGRNAGTIENSSYKGNTVIGEFQSGLLIGYNTGSFDRESTDGIVADGGYIGQFANFVVEDPDYHRLIVSGDDLVLEFKEFRFGDGLLFSGLLNIKAETDFQDVEDNIVFNDTVDFDENSRGNLVIDGLHQSANHILTLTVTDNEIYTTDEIKVVDGQIEILDPIGEDDEALRFRVYGLENFKIEEARVSLINPDQGAEFVIEYDDVKEGINTITGAETSTHGGNVGSDIAGNLENGNQIIATLFVEHELAGENRRSSELPVQITSDATLVGSAAPEIEAKRPGNDELSTTIRLEEPGNYEYLVNKEAEAPIPDEWEDNDEVESVEAVREIENIYVGDYRDDTYVHVRFSGGASQVVTAAISLEDISADGLRIPAPDPRSSSDPEAYGEVEFENIQGNFYINERPDNPQVSRPSLADGINELNDELTQNYIELNRGESYELEGRPDDYYNYYIIEVEAGRVSRFGEVRVEATDYSVDEIADGSIEISHGIEPGSIKIEAINGNEHEDHDDWVVDIGTQISIPHWFFDDLDLFEVVESDYSVGNDIKPDNFDISGGHYLHLYSTDSIGQVLEFYQVRIEDGDVSVDGISGGKPEFTLSDEFESTDVSHSSFNDVYIGSVDDVNLDRPARGTETGFIINFGEFDILVTGPNNELEAGDHYVLEVDNNNIIVGFDEVTVEAENISVKEIPDLELKSGSGPESTKVDIGGFIKPVGSSWSVAISERDRINLPYQGEGPDENKGKKTDFITNHDLDTDITGDELEYGNWIFLYNIDGNTGEILAFASKQLEVGDITAEEIKNVSFEPGDTSNYTKIDENISINNRPTEVDHFRVDFAQDELNDFPPLYSTDTDGVRYDNYDELYRAEFEVIEDVILIYALNADGQVVAFYQKELENTEIEQ